MGERMTSDSMKLGVVELLNLMDTKKISAKELTEKVSSSFFEDCNFLNCETPTHQPKATEHIDLKLASSEDQG